MQAIIKEDGKGDEVGHPDSLRGRPQESGLVLSIPQEAKT